MFTLPFLAVPSPSEPRSLRRILIDTRKEAAHELVTVFELLASVIGREAAVRDPRVRTAARRYRMLCGESRR